MNTPTMDAADRLTKEPAREYAARRSIETGRRYSVWENDAGGLYAAWDCAANDRAYRDLGACKVATYARGRLLP